MTRDLEADEKMEQKPAGRIRSEKENRCWTLQMGITGATGIVVVLKRVVRCGCLNKGEESVNVVD